MATRDDVAKRAGVSVATVSYALNNKNKISEETRQRVLQAVEELGYRPNVLARSLKTKKSYQLAVLVNHLGNPFEAGVVSRIETAALARDYFVFVQTYRQETEEQLQSLLMGRVDGIILLGQTLMDATIEHFRNLNVPIVSITKPVWERRGIPYIDMNWMLEMRKAIRHLQERGHDRIGFMTNGNPAHHHTERFQAFLQAMQVCATRFDHANVINGGGTYLSAYSAMEERLRTGQLSFTAMLCANDLMAIGAIAACRDHGIAIPQSLAIIGGEDILMSSETNPPLTTIQFPREEIGRQAVQMLFEQMDGQEGGHCIIEGELLVRSST